MKKRSLYVLYNDELFISTDVLNILMSPILDYTFSLIGFIENETIFFEDEEYAYLNFNDSIYYLSEFIIASEDRIDSEDNNDNFNREYIVELIAYLSTIKFKLLNNEIIPSFNYENYPSIIDKMKNIVSDDNWNKYKKHFDPKGKLTKNVNKNGFIYFILWEEKKLIKIGFTRNVKRRMNQLKAATLSDIILLKTIVGSEKDEKKLHKKFSSIRSKNEWFNATTELVDFIGNLDNDKKN